MYISHFSLTQTPNAKVSCSQKQLFRSSGPVLLLSPLAALGFVVLGQNQTPCAPGHIPHRRVVLSAPQGRCFTGQVRSLGCKACSPLGARHHNKKNEERAKKEKKRLKFLAESYNFFLAASEVVRGACMGPRQSPGRWLDANRPPTHPPAAR